MTVPMTACEWRLGDWPDPRSGDLEPIRIVERPGYTDHQLGRLPIIVRYAVVRSGWIATRDHEWTLEPQPSSRDDDFYAATRFDDWEQAAALAQRMATIYRESWNRRSVPLSERDETCPHGMHFGGHWCEECNP